MCCQWGRYIILSEEKNSGNDGDDEDGAPGGVLEERAQPTLAQDANRFETRGFVLRLLGGRTSEHATDRGLGEQSQIGLFTIQQEVLAVLCLLSHL